MSDLHTTLYIDYLTKRIGGKATMHLFDALSPGCRDAWNYLGPDGALAYARGDTATLERLKAENKFLYGNLR